MVQSNEGGFESSAYVYIVHGNISYCNRGRRKTAKKWCSPELSDDACRRRRYGASLQHLFPGKMCIILKKALAR